jgi:hypothetical protein
MGTGKKATARTSCCNIHNATTPVQRANNLRNTSKYMGASKSMSKDKSMDASNSRADNRRKLSIAWMPATSWTRARAWTPLTGPTEETFAYKLLKLVYVQGNSGPLVEYWVGNLRIGGSRPTCAQLFFQNTAGKFRWRGKFSRKIRPRWQKNFLLYVRI